MTYHLLSNTSYKNSEVSVVILVHRLFQLEQLEEVNLESSVLH